MKMFKYLLNPVLAVTLITSTITSAILPSLAQADCSSRYQSRIYYLESRQAKRVTILNYNVKELEQKLLQELEQLRAGENAVAGMSAMLSFALIPIAGIPVGLVSTGFILGAHALSIGTLGVAGVAHYQNNKIEKKMWEDYQQFTDKIRKAEAATIASIGDELGDRKQTMRALLEAQGLEIEENIELMSQKTGVPVEKIKALFVKVDQAELFCPGGKLLSSLEVGTIVSQMMWDEVYKENKRRK